MNAGAFYYNHNLQTHGGKMEGVITIKEVPDKWAKSAVVDYERGLTNKIMPYPWQSETCIGDWHYDRALFDKPGEYGGYLQPRDVIHWLIDTVSKNGTFILNIPGKPDGTIDSKEIAVLDRITDWMTGERRGHLRDAAVEGLWRRAEHDQERVVPGEQREQAGREGHSLHYAAKMARCCTRRLSAGPPRNLSCQSLGTSSTTQPGKIDRVQLLGTEERPRWKQAADGLHVELPKAYKPAVDFAAALKISLA